MSTETRQRSVTSHWLFAPAVGLWFAVLLGAGLFLMPADVLGQISDRTRLASVLPLVAAPVTLMGRIAISGIAAVFGLLLGTVIAKRIARSKAPTFEDDQDEAYVSEVPVDEQDDVWIEEEEPRFATLPVAQELLDTPRVFNPREDIGEEGIAYGGSAFAGHVDEAIADDEPWAQDVVAEAAPVLDESLADLPLNALNERLAEAFARHKQRLAAAPSTGGRHRNDSAAAYLRHGGGEHDVPEGGIPADQTDPQQSLRSALERLTQTGSPR